MTHNQLFYILLPPVSFIVTETTNLGVRGSNPFGRAILLRADYVLVFLQIQCFLKLSRKLQSYRLISVRPPNLALA